MTTVVLDNPTLTIATDDVGAYTENPSGPHHIASGLTWEQARSSVLAAVFGVMARLAAPIVEHHHGDLFHDATALGTITVPVFRVAFQPYESGTSIAIFGQPDMTDLSIGPAGHLARRQHRPTMPWWWIDTIVDTPTATTWKYLVTECIPVKV